MAIIGNCLFEIPSSLKTINPLENTFKIKMDKTKPINKDPVSPIKILRFVEKLNGRNDNKEKPTRPKTNSPYKKNQIFDRPHPQLPTKNRPKIRSPQG